MVVLLLPAAATAQSQEEDSTTALTVTSISTVVEGEGSARVQGVVTNTGEDEITETNVDLVSREAGSGRTDIAEWAEGTDPVTGTEQASVTLEDIAPGDSATFTMEVGVDALAPDLTAGSVWVSLQTEETAVHTFIGVHRAKEYVPLQVVWGTPLLLPSDRRLLDEPSADRTEAWEEAVGPESRLARLTEAPPAADEAWILDPSLLALPPDPPETVPASQGTAMTEELDLRSTWAGTLRENLSPEQTIVLPEADADVATATRSEDAAATVTPRIEAGEDAAEQLEAHGGVLWPADGLVTARRADALTRLTESTATMLTDTSALAPGGFTPTGAARTEHGTRLLVSDEILSDLAGGLSSPEDAVLARQRLVAETSAILGERPGTSRTVLVTPDRGTEPDPEAWAALRGATGEIPWLQPGSLDGLLEEVDGASPEATPRTARQIAQATGEETTPPAVLTEDSAATILTDTASMGVFASVRDDGEVWQQWVEPALAQLTSTRWRREPETYATLQSDLTDEVTLGRDDVVVSSGEVNFFADTGRLQITIVNETDVRLTNLTVEVDSSTPSFRIQQPTQPLTIGPDGRQKVTVQATALAAGRTPVHVVVSTPDGRELSRTATLEVLMRPTGETVYWVIGGVALALLGAGTWRSVRRRRQPTTTEDTA